MSNKQITALFKLVANGNLEEVSTLIAQGADVNETMPLGRTLLMLASEKGYLELVQLLIQHGANIHALDSIRKVNALMWACEFNHLEVAQLLIKLGADVNIKGDIAGVTPLMFTSRFGFTPLTALLLTAKPQLDTLNYNFASTALIIAARYGFLDIVKLLVAAGANTEIRSKSGETARDTANNYGHTAIVEFLSSAARTCT